MAIPVHLVVSSHGPAQLCDCMKPRKHHRNPSAHRVQAHFLCRNATSAQGISQNIEFRDICFKIRTGQANFYKKDDNSQGAVPESYYRTGFCCQNLTIERAPWGKISIANLSLGRRIPVGIAMGFPLVFTSETKSIAIYIFFEKVK